MNLFIFGPPGVGKGTQSKMLQKRFGMDHVSTGDLFRRHKVGNTELAQKIASVPQGELVPDSITNEMVVDHIRDNGMTNHMLIDGYPRNIRQASFICEYFESEDIQIDAALSLEAPTDVLVDRIKSRGVLEKRDDDLDAEVINKRIEIYNNKTLPVLGYFKSEGVVVLHIDSVGSIDAMDDRVMHVLQVSNLIK